MARLSRMVDLYLLTTVGLLDDHFMTTGTLHVSQTSQADQSPNIRISWNLSCFAPL